MVAIIGTFYQTQEEVQINLKPDESIIELPSGYFIVKDSILKLIK